MPQPNSVSQPFRAEALIRENVDILHAMKDALMKYETIDANQIDDLMERKTVRAPKDWDNDDEQASKKSASKDKADDSSPDDSAPSNESTE